MNTPQAGQIGEEEQEQIHWRDFPQRVAPGEPVTPEQQPAEVPDWLNPNLVPEKVEVPLKKETPL